jgi:hypothetical protein
MVRLSQFTETVNAAAKGPLKYGELNYAYEGLEWVHRFRA